MSREKKLEKMIDILKTALFSCVAVLLGIVSYVFVNYNEVDTIIEIVLLIIAFVVVSVMFLLSLQKLIKYLNELEEL